MMHARFGQVRLLGGIAIALALAACNQNGVRPSPSPTPNPTPAPTAPASNLTVTATVLEFTAPGVSRPLANLRLKVWSSINTGGMAGATALADVVSNASGTITIPDVPRGTLFLRTEPGSDYRFLCDAYPLFANPDFLQGFNTQLPVVPTSWSGTRPPQNWLMGTSFYGTVTERDNAGNSQPVEGAIVDGGTPDPPATTNAQGFYMVCSTVGADQFRTIVASKAGYNNHTRDHFFGFNSSVIDFELTRK